MQFINRYIKNVHLFNQFRFNFLILPSLNLLKYFKCFRHISKLKVKYFNIQFFHVMQNMLIDILPHSQNVQHIKMKNYSKNLLHG